MTVKSGGHWVGVTHDGSILCLSRGNQPLAMPPGQYAAGVAVLASISGYTMYGMLGCLPRGRPCCLCSISTPHATARSCLVARELVRAWRQRHRLQVVFHAPSPRCAGPGWAYPGVFVPPLPPPPPAQAPPPSRVPPVPPPSSPSPRHGDRPAPAPARERGRGVHYMHGRLICGVVGTTIGRPLKRPLSLKIGPQIKSNQPPPPPRLTT